MRIRSLVVTAVFLAPAPIATAQNVMNADTPGIMGAIQPVIDGVTTRCPFNAPTTPWSVSAIVAPGVQQNPFTPQLVPPGTPNTPTIIGFQQYRLFDSPKVIGHYLWRMTWPQLPLSGSDQLNGIDGRYQIDMYAVSYRTFDVKTNQWSAWSTQGSFGNEVHFAQFIVERRNRLWTPRGIIYMQPMGMKLQGVNCSDIPPLD